ncbi:DUF1671-domain-containing protein, partial [Periconia macrospinosa]
MATSLETLECPMCGYAVAPGRDYVLQLHFEQTHTDDSPFVIEDDPEPLPPSLADRASSSNHDSREESAIDDNENHVLCPEPDCCELIPLQDFNDHLEYHAGERLSFDDSSTRSYHSKHSTSAASSATDSPAMSSTDLSASRRQDGDRRRRSKKHSKRGRSDTVSSEKSTLSRSIAIFNPFSKPDKKVRPPSNTCRLGRNELGPHAWEDRMPRWLHDQLAAGPEITMVNRIGRDGRLIKQEKVQNETPGIIPILAQLSALDRSVKEAYYCHPSTLHIGKTPKEGGFCGYRNIQMLISYIQGARAQGVEEFPGRTPGVLKLQDLIERAWDKGINEIGRQQTGGIRDTRKYIGTPEAQALFLSSQIDCAVEMFSDARDGSVEAHEALLTAVETYFAQAATRDNSNVYKTLLPPLYLQQPGHSITVVGFERRHDGSRNLMVFDPMYSTSPAMHRLIGRKNIKTARPEVMWNYRRVAKQLKKHAAFEILLLSAHPPLFPAWDVLRQFPDCRYLYVFFRSRTLGYDVYPEDHFLHNFPWQQYGGLWIVDDARFARSEAIDPTTAQVLRRITGEGASHGARSSTVSSLSTSLHHSGDNGSHLPIDLHHHHGLHHPGNHVASTSCPPAVGSALPIFDGHSSGIVLPLNCIGTYPPYHVDTLNAEQPTRLSTLTDVGRRYPGYPTPLSPTCDAKQFFPSPASDAGDTFIKPSVGCPFSRTCTPMSVDGSHMRCDQPSANTMTPNNALHSLPLEVSTLSPSPPSSPTLASPRAAMLKNMASKQALQGLSHQPNITSRVDSCIWPSPVPVTAVAAMLTPPTSPLSNVASPRKMHKPAAPDLPPLNTDVKVVSIADGVETCSFSPISPHGTMLSYTSNRSVESGLLAVMPLSEAQVAEYRFWRPCGKGKCSFGCGAGREGEWAAARRLFRSVEEVAEEAGE